MSRVKIGQKYVNENKYNSIITGPSKLIRIHSENEDYHNCIKLSHWLFVKYDMTYKQYRNKSKNKRNELRKEFEKDTKKGTT